MRVVNLRLRGSQVLVEGRSSLVQFGDEIGQSLGGFEGELDFDRSLAEFAELVLLQIGKFRLRLCDYLLQRNLRSDRREFDIEILAVLALEVLLEILDVCRLARVFDQSVLLNYIWICRRGNPAAGP